MSLKTGFDELWRSDDDDESEAPATARGGNRADDDVWDSDGSEHGGDRPASSSIAARDGNSIRAKHYKVRRNASYLPCTAAPAPIGPWLLRLLALRAGRLQGQCGARSGNFPAAWLRRGVFEGFRTGPAAGPLPGLVFVSFPLLIYTISLVLFGGLNHDSVGTRGLSK